MDIAVDYLKKSGREVEANLKSVQEFNKKLKSYAQIRQLPKTLTDENKVVFPDKYGILEREHFYKEVSYHGNGGSSGFDSVIIAYDALLGCNGIYNYY